ncbi:MAG: hypothetical protein WKF87_14845 [Chryseolinea sp.]
MTTKCATHKKSFLTHDQAVDALVDARVRFEYSKGNGPVSVYKCEDCGAYHLTSKGLVNETLQQRMKDGKIELEKEANRWLHKINKR